MKHEELTKKVIGCSFEVINELGAGFLESVYHNALRIALGGPVCFANSGLREASRRR